METSLNNFLPLDCVLNIFTACWAASWTSIDSGLLSNQPPNRGTFPIRQLNTHTQFNRHWNEHVHTHNDVNVRNYKAHTNTLTPIANSGTHKLYAVVCLLFLGFSIIVICHFKWLFQLRMSVQTLYWRSLEPAAFALMFVQSRQPVLPNQASIRRPWIHKAENLSIHLAIAACSIHLIGTYKVTHGHVQKCWRPPW